jgi:hypothetical protein
LFLQNNAVLGSLKPRLELLQQKRASGQVAIESEIREVEEQLTRSRKLMVEVTATLGIRTGICFPPFFALFPILNHTINV